MMTYRIDRNRYPLQLRQACKLILQTEPYKSEPRYKGLRKTLESHIQDLTHEPEES